MLAGPPLFAVRLFLRNEQPQLSGTIETAAANASVQAQRQKSAGPLPRKRVAAWPASAKNAEKK
jgi:hypothetical protein